MLPSGRPALRCQISGKRRPSPRRCWAMRHRLSPDSTTYSDPGTGDGLRSAGRGGGVIPTELARAALEAAASLSRDGAVGSAAAAATGVGVTTRGVERRVEAAG